MSQMTNVPYYRITWHLTPVLVRRVGQATTVMKILMTVLLTLARMELRAM